MAKDEMATSQTIVADEAGREGFVELNKKFFRHWPAFVYSCILCMGGFQFGLDQGAIAGMQAMPGFLMVFGYKDATATLGWSIDPTVQQLISSLMSIGAFVACASAGPLGRYVSRLHSFIIAIILNYIGVILMMVATNIGTLYAGRLIIGMANGYFNVLPQLYIHESAPALQRGALLGCFNVSIGVGLLIGSIIDNYLSTMMSKNAYRIPLGIFFIIPTIIGAAIPFLPETPRWLLEHGKVAKAKRSLERLRHKNTSPQLIEAELEEMKEALETERQLTEGVAILELFRHGNLRRTLLSWAVLTTLGGSGALLFLGYGTYWFSIAGQTAAFQESVGMTAAGLVATILSMFLITKIGRRTILLIGFGIQALCMIITAAASQRGLTIPVGKVLVAFTIIYLFFYNMCVAPYTYLVAGEIPSQRLRGYTLGISIAIAFFFGWLVSYTAPFFINPLDLNWGPKYGYIWFGSNVIIFIFIYFFVPETKDRTLEEIDEMFEDKVPARKFKGYICVRANHARLIGMNQITGDKSEAHHVENTAVASEQ